MIADVFDYISDHMDLSRIVIGLITSGKVKTKMAVPVEDLNVQASLNCSLDKEYVFSAKNTKLSDNPRQDHIWVNQFPDVVTAVKHNVEELEITQTVSIDLNIKAGITKKLSGSLGAQKDYKFYVFYAQ